MAGSVLAIVLGFVTIIIPGGLVAVLSANILLKDASEPTGIYLAINIVFSVVFSVIGGYVASVIEKHAGLTNVKILAVIIFFYVIINYFIALDNISIWYWLLLLVLQPMCVLTGGHINNNKLNISSEN